MDALTFLEKTVDRLRGFGGHYAEIARRSGISYSSLVKLAQGHADNPTIESLQRVIEALNAFEGVEPGGEHDPAVQADPVMDPVMELCAEPSGDMDADRIVPLETA
ncbi:hypothetical protein [Stenotrophomonas lactitubi]|uniref:helix-turn-helix domain-containing protein n=1 Tax=Stenotrophomonas lactitubi TaxID=2045214 RepID=UPI003209CCD6